MRDLDGCEGGAAGVTRFLSSGRVALVALALASLDGKAGESIPPVAASASAATSAEAQALIAPWRGPDGGLPPFDKATPASIEAAFTRAIASKRAQVDAIASNPARPTFENTIAALEDSGRELQRVRSLFGILSSTLSTDELGQVSQRVAPLPAKLDDEIAHNEALVARVDVIYAARMSNGLAKDQQRVTEVIHDRMLRQGAGLPPASKARLEEINGRLAVLQAQFSHNLTAEEASEVVFIDAEAGLAGLSPDARAAAAAAATTKGRPGIWAIPNTRPAVWPFLSTAERRDLREKVWRMWTMRGDNPGEFDNKPLMAEILRLRGERARLLGFPDFAHLTTADRMARSPDTALRLLQSVWDRTIGPTQALLADLQSIADSEGAKFKLAPWDRLYYTDKLRRARFGLDMETVKPYLPLDSVLNAMFWAAGRLHHLTFKEIHNAPLYNPDVRVFELTRAGRPVGVLYLDLFRRQGKGRGSSSTELRGAESFRGKVLPIAALISSVERPADGSPALLTWDEANVWFHELGHTLQMLSNTARYPSLDTLSVPWDFIEVPALLNERWFHDPELLTRFAHHYKTGEPIPRDLIDKIEHAARFERVFSLNLDYLAPAIVDVKMHLLADGRDIDAVQLENQVLQEIGMPAAWDEIMRVPQNVHVFSFEYAAGLYSYLWSDVIAADIADAFLSAPGGLYDAAVAERWRKDMLTIGDSIPMDEAFRNFCGRDPNPAALLNRFGLYQGPKIVSCGERRR